MDDSRYQPSNNDRCHPKNSMCVKIDKRTKKRWKRILHIREKIRTDLEIYIFDTKRCKTARIFSFRIRD